MQALCPGRPCEDDCHCDRFRSSRTHRVRKENGNNAAAHTQPGAPDLTVRRRSSGPEVYADDEFMYLDGLIDANADIMSRLNDRSDWRGHATIVSSVSCTMWRMPRSN